MAGFPGGVSLSTCRLCAWLYRWIFSDSGRLRVSFWDKSRAWERANSNEYELWSAESDHVHELIEQARAIEHADPETAFRTLLEAAEAGSVWGMELVGWHYDTGTVVAVDFGQAQEYYYRALSAGSWMATIRYAQLLTKHEYFDHADRVLADGVRSRFVPAFFWQGWFRYKQSPTLKTAREVRPLLEYAAEKGHPGAQLNIARLMAQGRFGIREIPRGLALGEQVAARLLAEIGDEEADARRNTARQIVPH